MATPVGRRARRAHSEINVTPFVDVMLVLLVIFLATAPMLQQGMELNLPETTTQALRVRDSPLILSVNTKGEYFLGRKKVAPDDLETRLEAVFEARGSKEVYLRADREAAYGVVVKAMAAARRAGSTQISVVTEAEH